MTKIEAEKTIELYANCFDFKQSILYWQIKCFILENNDIELLAKLNKVFGE
jgi:hypothetical protein